MLNSGMQIYTGGLAHCGREWKGSRAFENRLKIWVPVAGSAEHQVGKTWTTCRVGRLYFIPGHQPQAWRCANQLDVYWFHARPESLVLDRRLAVVTEVQSWPLVNWSHWQSTWKRLPEFALTRDDVLGLKLQALTIEIISEILSATPDPKSKKMGARSQRFLPAFELMDRNFLQAPSMETLAKSVQMSVVHFHREFKRWFRITPHAHMQRRRMEQALPLLNSSEESISNIAAHCGYEDPFHFSRRFRAAFGCSPSAYRADPTLIGP
jgi:AraC-like DNA-binding protein